MSGLNVLLFVGVMLGYLTYIHAQTQKTITVKVASLLAPPYLLQSDGKWTGFIPDLLDAVGYNYTIYEPADGKYGTLLNETTWTGMIGELLVGNADVAGLLTVAPRRAKYIDFSYPVRSVGPTIVLKRPITTKPSLKENLDKLFRPFELSVWLMSFLALLVTGTVLYIISHFNPYEWRRMAKDREATLREGESFTCLNSFWFIVSTLMWQGYVRSPRSIGARLLVLSWFIFTIIFIASYTANLTNYLRIGPEPFAVEGYSRIRSFNDLAKNEDIRVGVIRGGSTEAHFANSKLPTDAKIYDKILHEKQSNPNIENNAKGLVDYLRGRPFSDYAVIIESDMAKYHVHQEPCDLYMVSEFAITSHQAFALPKGSPLKQDLDIDIMKLHESGWLKALDAKWFKSHCSETVFSAKDDEEVDIPKFYPVTLGTFSAAFLILVAGIVLGGLITAVEICIYKFAENDLDEETIDYVSAVSLISRGCRYVAQEVLLQVARDEEVHSKKDLCAVLKDKEKELKKRLGPTARKILIQKMTPNRR